MAWRSKITTAATAAANDIEEFVDVAWRRFSRRLGLDEPRQIVAYRGYANRRYAWVRGRLLANKLHGGPKEDDGWWDNLRASWERWESDELPGIDIRLSYAGEEQTVTTDEEGYYQAEFDIADVASPHDAVIASCDTGGRMLTSVHRLALVDEAAEYMIISDIDDTVIHTHITDLLLAAQLTFLHNARTRKPLHGAAALYRTLVRGRANASVNPMFYLSNSGWNMYDLLHDFLDLNDFPAGPLLLRDLGLDAGTERHKAETLRALLKRFDPLPAVLVGDSGQHDAQIYAALAREHPGRIKAIYIRDVDPAGDSKHDSKVDAIIDESEALGVPFVRIAHSDEIAHHAAGLGLIPHAEIDAVERDVQADAARQDPPLS